MEKEMLVIPDYSLVPRQSSFILTWPNNASYTFYHNCAFRQEWHNALYGPLLFPHSQCQIRSVSTLLWIPPPLRVPGLGIKPACPHAWAKRGGQAFDVSGLVGSTRGRVRKNEGEAAGRGRGAGDEGRQREKGKDMDWTIERRENTNKGRERVYVDRQEKEEGALKLWSYGPSKDLPPQSHTGGGSNRKERMAGGEERWWIMMGWISSSGPLSVYFLHFVYDIKPEQLFYVFTCLTFCMKNTLAVSFYRPWQHVGLIPLAAVI